MNKLFSGLGFSPADMLIPRGCDMSKWSVVACDQFTSQPEYWDDVEKYVGGDPSTLRLVLPESYLGQAQEELIAGINAKMNTYLGDGIFREVKDSFIYVERSLSNGALRRGLVGAADLEAYDFYAGAGSLIRATEGTVLERIPPRVSVRINAPLELPHVMLLIDDPARQVVERISAEKDSLEKLYDFELMKGGGHIEGYAVDGEHLKGIAAAIETLVSPAEFRRKYGNLPVMAYAVGDGNHSLAAAKACWEQLKATLPPGRAKGHPARYALVELVNIHDDSLVFEPIHRVVFDVEPQRLFDAFYEYYPSALRGEGPGHRFEFVSGGAGGVATLAQPGVAAGLLQAFLDDYTGRHGGRVDYIHGESVLRSLSLREGAAGFLLPAMGKSELFAAVIRDGVLPRKTFSMGEAEDKRYYLECRKIR